MYSFSVSVVSRVASVCKPGRFSYSIEDKFILCCMESLAGSGVFSDVSVALSKVIFALYFQLPICIHHGGAIRGQKVSR